MDRRGVGREGVVNKFFETLTSSPDYASDWGSIRVADPVTEKARLPIRFFLKVCSGYVFPYNSCNFSTLVDQSLDK